MHSVAVLSVAMLLAVSVTSPYLLAAMKGLLVLALVVVFLFVGGHASLKF